jgi:hypothetical protein
MRGLRFLDPTLGAATPALGPVRGSRRAALVGIGCRRDPLVAGLVTRARRAIGVHAVGRRRGAGVGGPAPVASSTHAMAINRVARR